jgi:hypothetical protein
MRIPIRSFERATRKGQHRKLKIGATTLVVAAITTAGAVSARAEDQPTVQELLEACDWADYCAFKPADFWQTVSDEHQVGDSAWNCSSTDQALEIGWSETKGSSNSVGVAVTAEASFFETLSVAVETSYSYTWEISHTWGQNAVLSVPPNSVGWVTRGTPEVNTLGQYELHFGERYYGHYYWYVDDYVQTGPDTEGTGQLAYHNRDMTEQEVAAHCSSSDPSGVQLTSEVVPTGDGVRSTVVSEEYSDSRPSDATTSLSSGD